AERREELLPRILLVPHGLREELNELLELLAGDPGEEDDLSDLAIAEDLLSEGVRLGAAEVGSDAHLVDEEKAFDQRELGLSFDPQEARQVLLELAEGVRDVLVREGVELRRLDRDRERADDRRSVFSYASGERLGESALLLRFRHGSPPASLRWPARRAEPRRPWPSVFGRARAGTGGRPTRARSARAARTARGWRAPARIRPRRARAAPPTSSLARARSWRIATGALGCR